MTLQRVRKDVGALCILLPMTFAAADAVASEGDKALPLWEVGIGGALYNQPNYPGSDVRSTTSFPFPYLVYRGERLRIDRSLQGILFESQRLKLDVTAGANPLVKSEGSDAREGMPDLNPTVSVGPRLNLMLSPRGLPYNVWGRLAVRAVFSVDTSGWDIRQQGWVLDTSVRYQRPLLGEKLRLSLEADIAFADQAYAAYYYDVAPAFATPARPAYSAGSGYAGANLAAGLDGRWGRWRWSVYGAYENLDGTVFANSPLVESKNDFSVGFTIGWVFWQSKRTVTPKNTSPGNEFETPFFGL
jgi:outer membrane scaffolding protein for murein synthesis (MipA/OmpV family)